MTGSLQTKNGEFFAVLNTKDENMTNIILVNASFSDCVLTWLNHKKEKIEQDTYECYESYVNVHITPYFKKNDVKLADVQPAHIEKFYAHLHQSGRKDGKGGLHIKTIKKSQSSEMQRVWLIYRSIQALNL